MSTLDIKSERKRFLLFSIFLLIFGFVYEQFSHGVYSYYMMGAFLIPLVLGYFTSFIKNNATNHLGNTLYNMGIVTLSIGSVFQGILEIFGTTNHLGNIYWYAGCLLIILGISIILIFKIKKNSH